MSDQLRWLQEYAPTHEGEWDEAQWRAWVYECFQHPVLSPLAVRLYNRLLVVCTPEGAATAAVLQVQEAEHRSLVKAGIVR